MTTTENLPATTKEPGELIRFAIDKGMDLDKLEKVLALQMEWEKNEARKAFHQAMSSFKANPPEINKDKKVAFNTTKYSHASLYNVTKKINSALSSWGLSASWFTHQSGSVISVTCRITHKQGHFEETTLSSGADKSGAKNDIQSIGSTVTYLQRYTLLALTGLATFDQDDDGTAAITEFISEREQHQLADLIGEARINIDSFLKYMKVERMELIPKAKFKQAVAAIEERKKQAAGAK